MFQTLSGEGHIIDSIENGVIKVQEGEPLRYTLIEVENTLEQFIGEVTTYRDNLRSSVKEFQKQGLSIDPAELSKLKAQFMFISETGNQEKEAENQEKIEGK